jgi:hypothetical protein
MGQGQELDVAFDFDLARDLYLPLRGRALPEAAGWECPATSAPTPPLETLPLLRPVERNLLATQFQTNERSPKCQLFVLGAVGLKSAQQRFGIV